MADFHLFYMIYLMFLIKNTCIYINNFYLIFNIVSNILIFSIIFVLYNVKVTVVVNIFQNILKTSNGQSC